MIKNILVALDGSHHADAASRAALTLGARLGARVRGLHVLDLWLLRGSFLHDVNGLLGIEPQLHMSEQVESFLKARGDAVTGAFTALAAEMGVRASQSVVTGLVAEELTQAAHENDLLVLGARGLSIDGGQGVAGRHLPSQLVGAVAVPMLVVTPAPPRWERAVVAFDGSPAAYRALHQGAELAREVGLTLTVTWVESGEEGSQPSDVLERARAYLDAWQVDAAFETRHGDPTEELQGALRAADADLLVLGSHGQRRLRDLVMGALPTRVINRGTGAALLVCP